jgi:hypothetical protein
MMHVRPVWLALATFAATLSALAGSPEPAKPPPPPAKPAQVPPAAAAALGQALRALLPEMFPPTLYEASPGWGQTATVWTGVKWKGKGIHARLRGKHEVRNHGTWRKIKITADPNSVALNVRDLRPREPGRVTFALLANFAARVEYVRQRWASGIKLNDQSIRARLRVALTLQCECVTRVEAKGFFPDVVFRLRVLRSDLQYGNVVCEHVAGLGGTTAKVAGNLLLKSLRRFHPGLERKLLDRANAAIVKAADTKEVRIEFSKLLGK